MQDIKALVVRNELQLEQGKIDHLISLINARSLSYLSPEKEAGPFLLYCCGDDLERIATKTSLPLEVIFLTAIYYRWPEKAKLLQKDITAQSIQGLQKDIAKSLLVATYIAMQKQLGDVIAGRVDPKSCGLIPKNMQALDRLMNMVNEINEGPRDNNTGGTRTTIQAQNVQINNNSNSETKKIEEPKELTPEQKKEREAMVKAVEGFL